MSLFITQGQSMLPSILPGARLEVIPAQNAEICRGDVVCYPSARNVMVAHRVIDITHDRNLIVRGDAHIRSEQIDRNAVALKAIRVIGPVCSYRVDGSLGRLFKKLALNEGTQWHLSRLCLAFGISRISNLKKRISSFIGADALYRNP